MYTLGQLAATVHATARRDTDVCLCYLRGTASHVGAVKYAIGDLAATSHATVSWLLSPQLTTDMQIVS